MKKNKDELRNECTLIGRVSDPEIWNSIFEYDGENLIRKATTSSRARAGDVVGCLDKGYLTVRFNKKLYFVHRIVWEMHNGPIPDGMYIDHINHKRDDNRLVNLRLVTRIENQRNMSISKRNSSGFVGVSWSKVHNKWEVRIGVGNGTKDMYCGRYDTIDEAVAARKKAELDIGYHKNHGE